ncbi:glycosyltransferase family 4 protein [Actinoplanes sp. Pm04-4]|uniref:Glycosyltransferase family 4 protein n=1 Tax=Paractinoplanes pyxinae TaxID=2997416 RepID=A0ABT4BES5_9ACTN|nr:glycosyltransferase family 4 protein [Actinoplanes pyxinae]MCY1144075.1 glycosyltransferase family 4 protein [Actinoplanes pyxinae]
MRDLYLGPAPLVDADVFMLAPERSGDVDLTYSPELLEVEGKSLSGGEFWTYLDRLSSAVQDTFGQRDYDVIHFQHLTFGATPALQRVFPNQPKVALLHGTDLLFAAEYPTQADVLKQAADVSAAVVVPTRAMADLLRRLTGEVRAVHIPWGVPDRLLAKPPAWAEKPVELLRVLYAGRLTAQKATAEILSAVSQFDGVELAVAGPTDDYARLAERTDLSRVRFLGWLSREQLWRDFADHDLLIVPSVKLEAFGLVTLEAQACGLPVAYQPLPGLVEVLGDSALACDFGNLGALDARFKEFRTSPNLLAEVAAAGLSNSARFPLSKTARELRELSQEVAQ